MKTFWHINDILLPYRCSQNIFLTTFKTFLNILRQCNVTCNIYLLFCMYYVLHVDCQLFKLSNFTCLLYTLHMNAANIQRPWLPPSERLTSSPGGEQWVTKLVSVWPPGDAGTPIIQLQLNTFHFAGPTLRVCYVTTIHVN